MDLLLQKYIEVFLFTVQTVVTNIIEKDTNWFLNSFKQIIQLFLDVTAKLN